MSARKSILLLPGDGIGPEIMSEAEKLLLFLHDCRNLDISWESGLIGGCAYEETGMPLPDHTLELALASDAVLLGAVGGAQWEGIERKLRPERGLLTIRSSMGLFANLRPAQVQNALADASSLKRELVENLDILIVRELTGGIYFGAPRGIKRNAEGQRRGFNTLEYKESEIRRIARIAFELAGSRQGRLCSVDKANVLEATELWREVVTETAQEYPDIELRHMYVDNAAMQLARAPRQFDVLLTTNMFGDILSDLAAMLTGSIGMLPSASLNEKGAGLYEPIHGSAPDIAGQGKANPLAMLLSVAMMLRHSFAQPALADEIGAAIKAILAKGLRTPDIALPGQSMVSTSAMGDAVLEHLSHQRSQN